MSTETFHTKVKGTTFYDVPFDFIATGDTLSWRRDPTNKHDPNAISLWWQSQQIGHLSAELAKELAPQIDAGRVSLAVKVTEITGGDQQTLLPGAGKPQKNRGVNLEVTVSYAMDVIARELEAEHMAADDPTDPLNLFG